MVVALALLAGMAWLLYKRVTERFLRAYGVFFTVLLLFVINKGSLNELSFFSSELSSPISLLRWLSLGALVVLALRFAKPATYRADVPLATMVVVFLIDVLLSSTYAEDMNYSLMRGLSFVLMAIAIFLGFSFFLFWHTSCLRFIRLHYHVAWFVLPLPLLFHFTGQHQWGATVLMGQYAGPFGNQNLFGVFSALILPYVLFHWKVETMTRRQWWLDAGLLGVIYLGVWLSNSRGGLLACLIATTAYYFTINLESRIKIVVAAFAVMIVLLTFPTLKSGLTSFIRKDTIERAEITDVTSQFYEERRYSLWSGVFPLYWKEKMSGYGFASSHLLAHPFSGDKEAGRHVHNSYLELFGDLGLPGLLLLLLILGRVAVRGLTVMQRRESYLQRNINAVFIAVFAAGAVNAIFESWMFSVGNIVTLMFWVPLAGIVAQWAAQPISLEAAPVASPSLKLPRPALPV